MSEHQQMQQSRKTDSTFQKQAALASQTHVSHPASIIQRARINPKSLTPADILQLQRTIGNRAVGRLLSEIRNTSKVQQAPIQRQKLEHEETCPSCVQRQEIPEEEEPLQGKMVEPVQRQEIPEEEEPLQGKMIGTIQRQEIPEEEEPLQPKRENNTGMPDNLKAGVESLSGIDISDVRVHYNSSKPAEVGALAYTQGANIHVAPRQEKHLPHEAWHVVQQKEGRVKPTMQVREVAINNDQLLEREADVMGAKTFQFVDNNREEIAQRKMETADNILQVEQLKVLKEVADKNRSLPDTRQSRENSDEQSRRVCQLEESPRDKDQLQNIPFLLYNSKVTQYKKNNFLKRSVSGGEAKVAQLAKTPRSLRYTSYTGKRRKSGVGIMKSKQGSLGRKRKLHARHIIPHSDIQKWILSARERGNAMSVPGRMRREIHRLLIFFKENAEALNWQAAYNAYEAGPLIQSFLIEYKDTVTRIWKLIEWHPYNLFLGHAGINSAIQNRFDAGKGARAFRGDAYITGLHDIWHEANNLLGLNPTPIQDTRVYSTYLKQYIIVKAAEHNNSRPLKAATGWLGRSDYEHS